MSTSNSNSNHNSDHLLSCGVKIKEYPPVISIGAIIDDQLLGTKSRRTVKKRLKELNVQLLPYEMVMTSQLFDAIMPSSPSQSTPTEISTMQLGEFTIPKRK